MEELLLINPRKRRGARKGRSAAQKAATRKMLAANRARRGGGKRRTSVVTVASNPRKRRSGARRRRNPLALGLPTRSRRSLGSVRGIANKPMSILGPALTGAIGAIAVNTTIGKLSEHISPQFLTGKMRFVTQAVAAIGLGMVASKLRVISAPTAAKMAEGALTVTLNDAIKEISAGMGMPLGGMGYYLNGRNAGNVTQLPSAPNSGQMAGMSQYLTGPGSVQPGAIPIRRGMGNIRRGF